MHRATFVAVLAAAAAAAGTAAAQSPSSANYLRLTAGATSADAARPRVDFGGGLTLDGRLSDRTGVQVGAAVGHAWRWARLEVEYQYGAFDQRQPALGTATGRDSGAAHYHTGMVNAYATAPIGGSLALFAGAGAGVARFSMPGLKPSATCTCFSAASRTAFAYQGRVGGEWRFGDADAVVVQLNHLRLPKLAGGNVPRTRYAARDVEALSVGYLRRF